MSKYDPKAIEPKWQQYWDHHGTFHARDFSGENPKYFPLVEFPYPSGAGLHVGHPRPYTAMDVIARKRRMEGYNVLYPIGWDAFGLPTENYAIKTGRPPAEVTAENIANFTRQIKSLGISFDWSRQVDTTDPKYYKWTQWIFLQLFKRGLAYKAAMPINWCLNCKIGLANEEVVDGRCERCGGPVEKRNKEQWMLAITKYADRLLEDLDTVDYITPAKIQQKNWIGKSEGTLLKFSVENAAVTIEVFTTRLDTIFSGTFLVLAPEHQLVTELTTPDHWAEVAAYIQETARLTDIERMDIEKEKTGVFTGSFAINPATGERMPIWISDFVLAHYGTGAVFADAHDERDFEMAKKYNLPLKVSIRPADDELWERVKNLEVCYSGEGVLVNSDQFDGVHSVEARIKILDWLAVQSKAEKQINYKLRDWVFSRQRYWGEPIPLVHCEKCAGWVPLPEDQLPLELPKVEKYQPTDTGESPLATMTDWVNTTCPQCGGPARRETDTMPNWAGSSWYFLRYLAPHDDVFFTKPQPWKRPALEPSEYDKLVRESFLKIRDIFKKVNVRFWICGSLLMNALNREQWVHMDDIDIHVHGADYERAIAALTAAGLTENKRREGSVEMTHGEVDIELIAVWSEGDSDFSYYSNGQKIKLAQNDLEMVERGALFGVTFRTVSPWHALYQYTYLQKYFEREKEGDGNKRQFLTDYISDPVNYWMGVDWYNGGMEHTVLHLLYSRFWNKFLFDIGVSPVSEPYNKRTSHGLILAKGGEKMSKSKGNVVNPDEIVDQFGADALRAYIMFMGPFDQAVEWDTNGLVGVRRFLERVWNARDRVTDDARYETRDKLQTMLHQTIKKVSEDIEAMRFNTAVAKLMELSNEMSKTELIARADYQIFIKLLAPFAPHLAEELWAAYGDGSSVAHASWPQFDAALAKEREITVVVQINGKVRAELTVSPDITEADIIQLALAHPAVQKWLAGHAPKKIIYVDGKLVSVVV